MKLIPADRDNYVLAVDPGGHTGMAWLVGNEFGSHVQPGGRFGFWKAFTASCAVQTPDTIVIEDFIINAGTAKKSAQVDPWRILGWLEGWCHLHGVNYILQTPSQAKGFGTDAKLKHLGWYKTGNGGHDNDAARHLLVYLTTHRHPDVVAKLKEFTP